MKVLEAGEVLGSGGYGCVLSYGPGEIAKFNFGDPSYYEFGMTDEEHLALQRRIRALDPDEHYFVTTKEIRTVNIKDLPAQVQTDIEKCRQDFYDRISDNAESARRRLRRSDTVNLYIQNRADRRKPLGSWTSDDFRHVYEGLQILHANGITHGDIALINFAKKNGKPVYIDFDLSSTAQNPKFDWNEGRPILRLDRTFTKDLNMLREIFRFYVETYVEPPRED